MSSLQEFDREQLESAVYNMFGMLRVLLPGDQKGMGDVSTFLKTSTPMMVAINKRIREDAVERVVAFLSGMGYVIDNDMMEKLKNAATNFRRKENNPQTESSAKSAS